MTTIFDGQIANILVIVASFYAIAKFVEDHLSSDAKTDLALRLLGAGRATWAQQLVSVFSRVFGPDHFSWRTIFRSCLASIFAVLSISLVYFFSGSSISSGDIAFAMMLGAIVNLIPDYFSLLQTRLLLERFTQTDSFARVVAWTIVDLALSMSIIGLYIGALFLLFPGLFALILERGGVPIVLVFVASSLFTSLFAWLYLLSTPILRLISGPLSGVLDVENRPLTVLALLAAGIYAIIAITTSQLVEIVGQTNSAQNSIIELRRYLSDADVQTLEVPQLVAVMAAFLLFIWSSHSALLQAAGVYLSERRSAGLMNSLHILFSLSAIAVVAAKVAVPSLWNGWLNEQSSTDLVSPIAYYIVPEGLPLWQLASALNGCIAICLIIAAEKGIVSGENTLAVRIVRVFSAILSAYAFCALVYITLSINWVLPPLCEGLFPWSAQVSC